MPTINNTVKRPGHYLVHEESERLSRENVILTGANYVSATVLGQVTATKKFKQVDAAASDGTENAAAILFGSIDASTEDQTTVVHDCLAEVRLADLVWPDGATQGQIDGWLADLKAQHIKAR